MPVQDLHRRFIAYLMLQPRYYDEGVIDTSHMGDSDRMLDSGF